MICIYHTSLSINWHISHELVNGKILYGNKIQVFDFDID